LGPRPLTYGPSDSILAAAEKARVITRRLKSRVLFSYKPYPKQAEFHAAGRSFPERMLSAGNQDGKTWPGSREAAMHLTGFYPDWWEGRVFDHPTVGWTGSPTNETSRDVVQEALLGPSNFASKEHSGTGTIPGERILDITKRQAGVPNVADQIFVRHKSGGISQCSLKTYQQEDTTWTGKPVDWIWTDEEPPKAIYSEMQARIMAADGGEGGIIYMTYTPIKGMTAVTGLFWEPAEGASPRKLIVMTIYDAEHYTDEQREKKIQAWMPYERECRAMGVPMMGEGLIWPIPDEEIAFDLADFPDGLPGWFARIAACDFGIGHPAAGAWLAHDRDQDIAYLYDCYKKADEEAVYHAEAFKARDPHDYIPVAWPHDGIDRDPGTGKPLKDTYRKHGANMMRDSARYDDKIGGAQGREPINQEIHERMKTGRFRVARHLVQFFDEKRMYHRKDGKVVAVGEDIISAVRMGMMMLRKARVYTPVRLHKPRYTRPIVT
ncbi:hypothetical protein LCGC14_2477930, partial [marine sediment metagenome]